MVRSSWWLAAGVAFGCASSPESSRPPPDATVPVAAQALDSPAERALPDAGLTLQPMVRRGWNDPGGADGAADPHRVRGRGFRAPQNDAPPPVEPVLRTPQRPYAPTPPKPDSQGRMPAEAGSQRADRARAAQGAQQRERPARGPLTWSASGVRPLAFRAREALLPRPVPSQTVRRRRTSRNAPTISSASVEAGVPVELQPVSSLLTVSVVVAVLLSPWRPCRPSARWSPSCAWRAR